MTATSLGHDILNASQTTPTIFATCLRAGLVTLPVAFLPILAYGSSESWSSDSGVMRDVFVDAPAVSETGSEAV